jgi:hypothetical protein
MRQLATAVALAVVLSLPASLTATTITVDDSGGADHQAIQPAIDVAVYGDTVLVRAGYYPGRIFMKNGVVLLGAGAESTTIDNAGLWHSTINFTPGWYDRCSRISGFTIMGALEPGPWMAGVWVGPHCAAEISYNVITGCRLGIDCKSNEGVPYIHHNTIAHNSDCGIWVYENITAPLISNNIIAWDGVAGVDCWVLYPYDVRPYCDYNCVYHVGTAYISVYFGPNDIWANPLFCGAPEDLHIQANSPCAGTGENGTDRGAYPAGCATSAVLGATWTSIKALYR